MKNRYTPAAIYLAFLCLVAGNLFAIPGDLSKRTIGSAYNQAAGVTFDNLGHMFVWERRGHVYVSDGEDKRETPIINIQEEVGNWGDFGLTGLALDPDFAANGLIYLMYSVDRHYLRCHDLGRCNYDANTDEEKLMTIGRITRYQIDVDNNTIVPGTRTILIGDTPESGFVIDELGHSIGHLEFGLDGSLLASCGDAASPVGMDAGNNGACYSNQPDRSNDLTLDAQILPDDQRVGAFRSQLLSSLNGKIVRIDPATGAGMADNPFYDAANPDSKRSKVWQLGLRNPYRFTIRPNSANEDNNGVGVLYIGDVGWDSHEELNVAEYPGMNFGWPRWEGFQLTPPNTGDYNDQFIDSEESNDCNGGHFNFHQLIGDDVPNEATRYSNKNGDNCDNGWTKYFFHTRPAIDFPHPNSQANTDQARIPTFNGNTPSYQNIGGEATGGSSLGGVFYTGTKYPERFQGQYFHIDYQERWLRRYEFDANNDYVDGNGFDTGETVVHMTIHPSTGDIYYVDYEGWNTVIKHIYNPLATTVPPVAIASSDAAYGPSGTWVTFDASQSYDPDGGAITYLWEFPNGDTSTDAIVTKRFDTGQVQEHVISLTVYDDEDQANTTISFSENNTPPVIQDINPQEGWQFSMAEPFVDFNLQGTVLDAEHGEQDLTYEWMVTELHNDHSHPVAPRYGNNMTWSVTSLGCQEEFGSTFRYEVFLRVTDAAGLSDTITQRHWADCSTLEAGFTVYFKQGPGWDLPKIHYWGVEPAGQLPASEWPGTDMTFDREVDGFNWYKFEFTDVTKTNLLFHDGNNQIPDILDVTRNQWYDWPDVYDADPRPVENAQTVVITAPDNMTIVGQEIELTYTVNHLDEANDRLVLYLDGAPADTVYAPFSGTLTLSDVDYGAHTLRMEVRDNAWNIYGNVEAVSRADFNNEAPPLPSVDISYPTAGAQITDTRIDVTFDLANLDLEAGDHVHFYYNGMSVTDLEGDVIMHTLVDVALGMHTITATVADSTNTEYGHPEATSTVEFEVVEAPEGLTIHFKRPDANYGTPMIHYWNAAPVGAIAASEWPGTDMESEGDNWYVFEMPAVEQTNFLIHNNTGNNVNKSADFGPVFSDTWVVFDGNDWNLYDEDPEGPDYATVAITYPAEGDTIFDAPVSVQSDIQLTGDTATFDQIWYYLNGQLVDTTSFVYWGHYIYHLTTGPQELRADLMVGDSILSSSVVNVYAKPKALGTISIVDPVEGQELLGDPAFYAWAYELGGHPDTYDDVLVYVDDTLRTTLYEPNGTLNLTVAIGQHTVRLDLVDDQGAVVDSDEVTITARDYIAGDVSIQPINGGQPLEGGTQDVLLNYTVSGDPQTYRTVQFYLDGTQVHEETEILDYAQGSYNYLQVTPGLHWLAVSTEDEFTQLVSIDSVQIEVLEAPDGITVYFQRPNTDYGQPKIHYWGFAPAGVIPASTWPGTDMNGIEDEWYELKLDQVTSTNFLIHNNTGNNENKSPDFGPITTDVWVTMDQGWSYTTVDPRVPQDAAVSITAPADGAQLEGGIQDILLTYELTGRTDTYDHIDYFIDGVDQGEFHDFPGEFAFNLVTIGIHTLRVELRNGHDIVVASDSVTIEVMEVPDAQVVITSPTEMQMFHGDSVDVLLEYDITGNLATFDMLYLFLDGQVYLITDQFTGGYVYPDVTLGMHTLRAELRQGANSVVSSDEVMIQVMEAQTGFTVYFQPPANYGQPKLHYWGVEPAGAMPGSAWPGADMEESANEGWYSFAFDEVEMTNLLIHNNTGNNQNKSADIMGVDRDLWITLENGVWDTTSVSPFVPSVWINSPADGAQVVGPDVTFDFGWANINATTASGDDHIHFYLDDDPRYAVHDPTGVEVFEGLSLGQHTMTLRAANAGHSEFQNPEAIATITFEVVDAPTGITVYFQKPASWPTANVHYWGYAPAGALPQSNWPGVEMESIGSGWYSYFFAGVTEINVLFNDGDGNPKTDDFLDITTDTYFDQNGVTAARPPQSKKGAIVADVYELNGDEKSFKAWHAAGSDRLTIQSLHPEVVTVYNAFGQVVWTGKVQGNLDLSTANWATGIYVAVQSDSREKVYVH